MSIKIVTDSTSDINQNQFENCIIVPLKVTIDGTCYRDGVDFSKDEFYQMLETSDALPVSSLASPFDFEEVYKQAKKDGDELIVLTISSGLSGTYQSAMIAKGDYDNISVIDSKLVSSALGILVRYGLDLVKKGLSREEIVEILEEEKKKIKIYAYADTLKYLEKGGRVSKGSAIFGGMLQIKPIITLDEDGKLISIGKSRGSRMANKFLNERIVEDGIDFSKPFVVGYAGTTMDNMNRYIEDNKYLISDLDYQMEIVQIGSAVGTHCGPGAVSLTYFIK